MKNYKTSVSVIAVCAMLSLSACEGKGLSEGGIFAEDIKPATTIKVVDETKADDSLDKVQDVAEVSSDSIEVVADASSDEVVDDIDSIIDITDSKEDGTVSVVKMSEQEKEEEGGFFSNLFDFGGDDKKDDATLTQKAELEKKSADKGEERGDLVSWLFGDDAEPSQETKSLKDEDMVNVPEIPREESKMASNDDIVLPKPMSQLTQEEFEPVKEMADQDDESLKEVAQVETVDAVVAKAEPVMDEIADASSPNRMKTPNGIVSIDDRAAQLRAELLRGLQGAEDTRSEFLGTPRKEVSFPQEEENVDSDASLEEQDVAEVDVELPENEEEIDVSSAPLSEDEMLFEEEQAEIAPEIDADDPETKKKKLEELAKQDESAALIARLIAEDKRKRAKEKLAEKKVQAPVNMPVTDAITEPKPVLMRAPRWTRTPSEEQATNLLARLEKEKKDITRVVSKDVAKIDSLMAEAEAAAGVDSQEMRERAKYVNVRDLYQVTKTNDTRSILPDVSDQMVDELEFDAANSTILQATKTPLSEPVFETADVQKKPKSILIDPNKLNMLPSRIREADQRMDATIQRAEKMKSAVPPVKEAQVSPAPVGQVTSNPLSLLQRKKDLQQAQNTRTGNTTGDFLDGVLKTKKDPLQFKATGNTVTDEKPVFGVDNSVASNVGDLRAGRVVKADSGSLSMMSDPSLAGGIDSPLSQDPVSAHMTDSTQAKAMANAAPLSLNQKTPMTSVYTESKVGKSAEENSRIALANKLMEQAQALLNEEKVKDSSLGNVAMAPAMPRSVEATPLDNTSTMNTGSIYNKSIPSQRALSPEYGMLGNSDVSSVDGNSRIAGHIARSKQLANSEPVTLGEYVDAPKGNVAMQRRSATEYDSMMAEVPAPKLDQFATNLDNAVKVFDDQDRMSADQRPISKVRSVQPSKQMVDKPSLDRFRQALAQADRENGIRPDNRTAVPDAYALPKSEIVRPSYNNEKEVARAIEQETVQNEMVTNKSLADKQALSQRPKQKRIVVQPEYYYVPVPVPAPTQPQVTAPQMQMAMNMGQQNFNSNQRFVPQQQQLGNTAVRDYRRPVRKRPTDQFVTRGSAQDARQRVEMTADELSKINFNMQQNRGKSVSSSSDGASDSGNGDNKIEPGKPQPFSKF